MACVWCTGIEVKLLQGSHALGTHAAMVHQARACEVPSMSIWKDSAPRPRPRTMPCTLASFLWAVRVWAEICTHSDSCCSTNSMTWDRMLLAWEMRNHLYWYARHATPPCRFLRGSSTVPLSRHSESHIGAGAWFLTHPFVPGSGP